MSTTAYAVPEPSLADLLADRPLGPVFESRFTAQGARVHVSVVRGAVDLLDLARERAEELLSNWAAGLHDPPAGLGSEPETVLLASLAGQALHELPVAERVRALAPALVADLLVRELLDEGALGAALKVGDDAAFGGLPPRLDGWRVEVPGADLRPRTLLVEAGGVSTRGQGEARVTVTADHAWQAAAEAELRVRSAQPTGTVRASRSAPA